MEAAAAGQNTVARLAPPQEPTVELSVDGLAGATRDELMDRRENVTAYIDQAERRLREARITRDALSAAIHTVDEQLATDQVQPPVRAAAY